MKIQSIQPQQVQQTKQSTSFKGAGISPVLNFLQTNQAIGATVVDAGFMCTPRTIVDFSRSPQAGVETMRREYTSSINDALLGVYGMGAAALMTAGINKKYGVDVSKLFIDNDKLDILADIKSKAGDLKTEDGMKKYLNEILDTTSAFSPNAKKGVDEKGWVKISEKTKKAVVDKLAEEINAPADAKGASKRFSETKKVLKAMLVGDTGAEADFKMDRVIKGTKNEKVSKSVTSSVDDYIDNIVKVSRTFMSDKVAKTFKEGDSVLNNSFVKGIKKVNAKTTLLGIGFCSALGAMVQPINMYLTKKKTGSSAFVGGGEENKTTKFKALKTGIAALAMTGALRSIGKFNEVFSKIQFKGLVPTLSQFKLVYGITIFSRLLSARNENELRESAIKDSLGFVNWLILGGFVSKLAASGIEKATKAKGDPMTLLKYNKAESKGLPKWLAGQVVSREEVLQTALKKAGISTIENGKAMNLGKLMNLAKQHAPKALKTAKILNLVQIAGYLYSGLAIGIGIPKLNIAITNAINAKNAKKEQAQKAA